MSIWFNSNNTATKVRKIYTNINGSVKKIKSAWVDKDGVATKIFSGAIEKMIVAASNRVMGSSSDLCLEYIINSESGENFTKEYGLDICNNGGLLERAYLFAEPIAYEGFFVCFALRYDIPQGGGTARNYKFAIRVTEDFEKWEELQTFDTSFANGEFTSRNYEIYFGMIDGVVYGKFPSSISEYKQFKLTRANNDWVVSISTGENYFSAGLPCHIGSDGTSNQYVRNSQNSDQLKAPVKFLNKFVYIKDYPYENNSAGFYVNSQQDAHLAYSLYTVNPLPTNKRSYSMPTGVFDIDNTEILILPWEGSNSNVVLSYTTSYDANLILPILNNGSEIVLFVDGEVNTGSGGYKILNKCVEFSKVIKIRNRYFVSYVLKWNKFYSSTNYELVEEEKCFELQYQNGVLSVKREMSSGFRDIADYRGDIYVTKANSGTTNGGLYKITNFDSGNDFTYQQVSLGSISAPSLGNLSYIDI